MANTDKVTEDILLSELTLVEVREIKKLLLEKYDMPAAEIAASREEQTEFDVILVEVGAKKISVIQEVRKITGLGLKEARDFVEAGAKLVKEGVSKDEAREVMRRLEAAGARVLVKPPIPEQNFLNEEDESALAWALADWLALGMEAKRRSASLDATLEYVTDRCSKIYDACSHS